MNLKHKPCRVAIIGDIHLDYDDRDTSFFNNSDYDLIMFVGDLSILSKLKLSLEIAQKISKLEKLALVIPGNHDVQNSLQVVAEIMGNSHLAKITCIRHEKFHYQLQSALKPAILAGYSIHPYTSEDIAFDVIAARPFAMGGSSLSFLPSLRKLYGVQNAAESKAHLFKLVDKSETGNIIFLAHNGPYGMSEAATEIWGCDFDPSLGDFGDRDLMAAISYAKKQGKRVFAVVAGHMHLQTYIGPYPFWKRRENPGPLRPWSAEKDEVLYINSARVPRVFNIGEKRVHHHIRLEIYKDHVEASEKLIENDELG